MKKPVKGFKLFRVRKDGSLGSLFINARFRIPEGRWLRAEDHPTPGYAHRPGWHATLKPEAPHLSTEGRLWCEVELLDVQKFDRPQSQGGTWVLAKWLRVTARRPDLTVA